MKKSFSSFLVPFAAILFSMIALGAQAQDDGISSYDLQNSSPDPIDFETRTSKSIISVRDSLQNSDFYQKPKVADRKPANPVSNSNNEEDDALSLNFLFYIIENYKFSDLMDK